MIKYLLFFTLLPLFLWGTTYNLADLNSYFKLDQKQILKLKKNRVITTDDFLKCNLTSKMRATFSRKYHLSVTKLRRLVFLTDLMRIKGIGPSTATLLYEVGVKNIIRLSTHKGVKQLQKQMISLNKERHIVPIVPSIQQLENWQRKAQKLPRILN